MAGEINGTYKDYHVKQMHSNGTTACETFATILPTYVATFITVLLESILFMFITKQKTIQFVIEYIVLILPMILSLTVLSKYLINTFVISIVIVTNLLLLIFNLKPSNSIVKDKKANTYFITNARSTINILSVTAILAVDFKVFPRYFAKTESFGYSLMDIGVGLFMYSNGIVAPEAKLKTVALKAYIKSSLPLFVLGTARFFFVKQIDYAVPVSEYGTHWNFFITLAVTKIICALLLNTRNVQHILRTAIFIIILHEILLQIGLQNFVLTNLHRDNFITANREGLVSMLGYISIYLFSIYFGQCLHIKSEVKRKFSVISTFVKYSILSLTMSLILQNYFGISRKLANSAYCFWILFIGVFMTGLYYVTQLLLEFLYGNMVQAIYSPLIFEAINYNGLSFFLIGNLLTGMVNLIFNTLVITDYFSLIILMLYMFVNCLTVTLFYFKECKFKL